MPRPAMITILILLSLLLINVATGEEFTPGKGYYRLQTMFLEKENKCLEGNKLGPNSVLKGAAFQDDCQNVSGQLWKFVAQ